MDPRFNTEWVHFTVPQSMKWQSSLKSVQRRIWMQFHLTTMKVAMAMVQNKKWRLLEFPQVWLPYEYHPVFIALYLARCISSASLFVGIHWFDPHFRSAINLGYVRTLFPGHVSLVCLMSHDS